MEISNLTLRRKNWKIFQEKLLLPWVRDMHYKKGRKEKEKRRKRKKNQSKIKEKQQKIEKKKRKWVLLTRQYLNNVYISQEKKYKREAMTTWLKPGGRKASPALVTNQIFVSSLVPRRTKEKWKQKKKSPEHPKPNFLPKSNPIKSY